MTIEKVTVDDAKKLLEIYTPYITDTAITFEYEIPNISEFETRIKNISEKYPYIPSSLQTSQGKDLVFYQTINM